MVNLIRRTARPDIKASICSLTLKILGPITYACSKSIMEKGTCRATTVNVLLILVPLELVLTGYQDD